MKIIKICRIKCLEDAQITVVNGLTHVGIIYVTNRMRTVSSDEAIKFSSSGFIHKLIIKMSKKKKGWCISKSVRKSC